MTTDRQAHWQSTYTAKGERGVSWFQESAQPSLALIEEFAAPNAAVIDIGGGSSRLADGLLDLGFRDVTILDLSSAALAQAKARIGSRAQRIRCIVANITTWEPTQAYDVWHDRATFHFLVAKAGQAAYLDRLTRALKPGGVAIIATFAPDGPKQCSGLPVMRYDDDTLSRTFGPSFRLLSARRHEHVTPSGATQTFQFCAFRRLP
jgi:trans-aconitate methyltransferase